VGNAFVRERDLLARLPLLRTRLEPALPASRDAAGPAACGGTKSSSSTAIATTTTSSPEEVIDYLRRRAVVLSYDPATRTLQADSQPPVHCIRNLIIIDQERSATPPSTTTALHTGANPDVYAASESR
jgi:hypothetical protein